MTADNYHTIVVERFTAVARVTLSRPDKRNAMNRACMRRWPMHCRN